MANGTMQMHETHTETNTGWVSFAGYMMVIVGFFHAIAGLVALIKPAVYLTTENNLWVFDYTQWGWIHLIFGALVVAAGLALFAGRMWGRVVAVVMATLSAIVNFSFIQAYPLWSILIIALDVMIIYSVAAHGGELAE